MNEPSYRPGMDRRRFLLTSLAGAFAGPFVAVAQRAGKARPIGYLGLIRSIISTPSDQGLTARASWKP
jgi:hypothetical protein